MTALVCIGILLVLIVTAVSACQTERPRDHAQVARQQQDAAVAQRRALQRAADQRRTAQSLQVAILQLEAAPDFRRAAAFAKAAEQAGVPSSFRQRQFQRLRARLVAHAVRRLEAGCELAAATAGLRELVTGMSVAAYEAEYIVAEAQGQQRAAPQHQPRSYKERLRTLHAEHVQRMEAIRHTADLDEEIREQLLEAEQERFRAALLDEPERN